jgi:prepilin-type N-terminal cleavage/methylation domain-containing protein
MAEAAVGIVAIQDRRKIAVAETTKPILAARQNGFTLIEVLVVMFLIALLLTSLNFATGGFSTHDKLERSIEEIERALRFARDEAALRNSVVRLRLIIDKTPNEYVVEFGPDDGFIIPKSSLEDSSVEGVYDAEEKEKKRKEIDRSFNRIDEFQSENKTLPDEVRIVGVAQSLNNKFVSTGQISLFVFPSGEMDDAIIIFGTDEEVASLEIRPFLGDFITTMKPLDGQSNQDLTDSQLSLGQELFDNWVKR